LQTSNQDSMKKGFLFTTMTLLLLSGSLLSFSQEREDIEQQRQQLQKEIKQIEGMYNKVKGQTRQTIGQLSLLNRKIKLQDQYVSTISREIRYLNDDIFRSNQEIYRLGKELDTLKSQYQRSVVWAYKNRSTYDYINFIFSSESFNDALKRISYLKSYRDFRENQIGEIERTQKEIEEKKVENISRIKEKDEMLGEKQDQLKDLEGQKTEKNAVVSKLKSQEKDLKGQLATKRKKDADLKTQIAAIVKREIELAKREAARKAAEEEKARAAAAASNKPAANKPAATNTETAKIEEEKKIAAAKGDYLNLNATEFKLNDDFENNKGKLPWPVDNGYVKIEFGRYTLPGTSLTGDNPGVTIATPSSGVTVKSIFDGEVSGVFNLGDSYAVTLRHGKYFTTYSNLSSVKVTRGTKVSRGQALGTAAQGEDGSGGQVDFILMVETKNVNPRPWLRPS